MNNSTLKEIQRILAHRSDTSLALGRTILSLYNGRDYPFAASKCLAPLRGDTASKLALALIEDYAYRGEQFYLIDLAELIIKKYPEMTKVAA